MWVWGELSAKWRACSGSRCEVGLSLEAHQTVLHRIGEPYLETFVNNPIEISDGNHTVIQFGDVVVVIEFPPTVLNTQN